LLPAYNTVADIEGRARLANGGLLVDGKPLAAGKIIIATGASPALPPIRGIETVPYPTSTTALDLEQLPRSLLVIGGGYIFEIAKCRTARRSDRGDGTAACTENEGPVPDRLLTFSDPLDSVPRSAGYTLSEVIA
jgi:hypothetical protein